MTNKCKTNKCTSCNCTCDDKSGGHECMTCEVCKPEDNHTRKPKKEKKNN